MVQTSDTGNLGEVREVVALFATRASFDGAVAALLATGFSRKDLSVLASHSALEAAEPHPAAPRPSTLRDDALTGLVGELKYAFPLATAGLIAIVGGPITAAVAAVVTAGLSGIAIKDYLDELTSHPDSDEFARALEAGGVILWVRADDSRLEGEAYAILNRTGGKNVHVATREEVGGKG